MTHRVFLQKAVARFDIAIFLGLGIGVFVILTAENPPTLITPVIALFLLVLMTVAALLHMLTWKNSVLFLWTIMVAHRALSPRTESVEVGSLVWSPYIIAEVLVTITIFSLTILLLLLWLTHFRTVRMPTSLKLLWAYVLMASLSLLYSPSPLYTGFWLIRLVSVALLVTMYFSATTPADATQFARITFLAMLPYLLLTWLAFIQGRILSDSRVMGFWLHPGQTSIIGYAVGAAYLVKWLLSSDRQRTILLALLGLGSAFIAAGKIGAVAMLIVLALVFAGTWRRWFSTRGVAGFLLIGLGLALLASRGVGLLSHLRYYQQLALGTLKARFLLWDTAIARWLESPLLGMGFASTRIIKLPARDIEWMTTHAHNSFLESLIEVGLLGSLPLFTAMGVVAYKLFRLGPSIFRDKAVGPIAAAWGVLLLSSVADFVFGGILQPPTYLFLGLLISLDVLCRRTPLTANRNNQTPIQQPSSFLGVGGVESSTSEEGQNSGILNSADL